MREEDDQEEETVVMEARRISCPGGAVGRGGGSSARGRCRAGREETEERDGKSGRRKDGGARHLIPHLFSFHVPRDRMLDMEASVGGARAEERTLDPDSAGGGVPDSAGGGEQQPRRPCRNVCSKLKTRQERRSRPRSRLRGTTAAASGAAHTSSNGERISCRTPRQQQMTRCDAPPSACRPAFFLWSICLLRHYGLNFIISCMSQHRSMDIQEICDQLSTGLASSTNNLSRQPAQVLSNKVKYSPNENGQQNDSLSTEAPHRVKAGVKE